LRIGKKFKRLAKKLPEVESNLLWSKADGKRVYGGFVEEHNVADEMKNRIVERASFVVRKAEENGEKARFTWHSCGDSRCSICDGKRPDHFHFEVKGKDVNLEEWLANYWSAEEVIGFIALIRNREWLLSLLHYQTILFRNLGLLED